MNYLLVKRTKRKKVFGIIFLVLFLFALFYFRSSIFNKSSAGTQTVFRPILILGNNLGERFSNLGVNENLVRELGELKARVAGYDAVVAENNSLKEILGRKGERNLTLAAILAKPNQSAYDTLIIDLGTSAGEQKGKIVFADGDVPIGKVAEAYPYSSKVILFSNPGEKTQVVIGSTFFELIGRGGGNFEMILPRDFTIAKGDLALLPGINPLVVGRVETIISDPRDAFQKALLASPVNLFDLKFVEVQK